MLLLRAFGMLPIGPNEYRSFKLEDSGGSGSDERARLCSFKMAVSVGGRV